MKNKFYFFPALLLFTVTSALCQADSASSESNAAFKVGIFHNTHVNYYGRTDSLRSSGSFPLAEIWFDKHFYLTAAPVFVSNSTVKMEYAGTVTTAGYMFRDKKWAGNVFVVKPFYRDNSELVQSALKLQATANFSRLNKVLNITAGGDVKYSDKLDYGTTLGVDHLIRWQGKNNLVVVLDPSAFMYAGTQQFTNTSYKKSGFLLFPGVQQEITEEVNNFSILSFEFSMPLVIAKGKFQVIVNPAYVMPQNLVTVPGRPDLSERGKDIFYLTSGIKYRF